MYLFLKHCSIADVQLDEQDSSKRVVKIQVSEEDLFEMLDHVKPSNIVKYLDMRNIPHRDALNINFYESKSGLSRLKNGKKMQRAMRMAENYNKIK